MFWIVLIWVWGGTEEGQKKGVTDETTEGAIETVTEVRELIRDESRGISDTLNLLESSDV